MNGEIGVLTCKGENFEFGGNYIRMIVPYAWKEQDNMVSADLMDGTVKILAEKEKGLLEMIAKYPNYSYEQYADLTHSSRRTIARMLKHLQDLNVVIRVGSDKGGHWKVIEE